jgi:PTH1 family peptidyl-tRNA hydrolase
VDWLIVGLGNPGREYDRTRHNVGFMVAGELARRWGLGPARDRFAGRITEGRIDLPRVGDDRAQQGGSSGRGDAALARLRVALLCPQTYMNDAGRSVGPARGALRLPLERVLVVHDEIDLSFGEVRARVGGGLAGHNGLKSIAQQLGGSDFARVRVGVGRPDTTDSEIVSAHVLGRFAEDQAAVAELVQRAASVVEDFIAAPPTAA